MTIAQRTRAINRLAEIAEERDSETEEFNAWFEQLRSSSGPHRPLSLEQALADCSDNAELDWREFNC